MSDNFDIKVDIPSSIQSGSVALSQEIRDAVRDSGLSVERGVKSFAPHKTGTLRRSITMIAQSISGAPTAIVGTNLKYAPYVEKGTGIYAGHAAWTVTPKQARALAWHSGPALLDDKGALYIGEDSMWTRKKSKSAMIFAKKVTIKGMKPRRYMQQGFDAKKASVQQRIQQAVNTAVKRMSGGS